MSIIDCQGFECDDGTCLNKDLHCNGNIDCSNGEDEEDCKGKFLRNNSLET